MSRKQFIRLDGDRLEQAIKLKGMTKREFGLECFEIQRRLGERKGIGFDEEKQASNWTSLLCRPEDDPKKRKTGVSPNLLPWISLLLGVRERWLTGADDYMTNEEAVKALEAQQHEQIRNAARECMTLITPLLEKAGYTYRCPCLDSNNNPAGDFLDSDHKNHVILAEDLRRIETVCIDLCASMFRELKLF